MIGKFARLQCCVFSSPNVHEQPRVERQLSMEQFKSVELSHALVSRCVSIGHQQHIFIYISLKAEQGE